MHTYIVPIAMFAQSMPATSPQNHSSQMRKPPDSDEVPSDVLSSDLADLAGEPCMKKYRKLQQEYSLLLQKQQETLKQAQCWKVKCFEKRMENKARREEHDKLGAWLGKTTEADLTAMRQDLELAEELGRGGEPTKEQKKWAEKLPIGAKIKALPHEPKTPPPLHLLSQASSSST